MSTSQHFYRAFEDEHRGTREQIQHRLRVYLPFIRPLRALYGQCAALDVGCGRGEWLELLLAEQFSATGVDLDAGMLEACHALQLPVKQGDAIAYLQSLPDASLTVISGFHIIEHIAFEQLQTLIKEAYRVLKPAGLLILETPNAENIGVASEGFYMDPTHEKPIPHDLLQFITRYAGFSRQALLRLQENPALHNEQEVLSLMTVLEGVSPDYAVVAQKAAPAHQLVLFDAAFEKEHGLSLRQLAGRYQDQVDEQLADLRNRQHEMERYLHRTPSWQLWRAARYLKRHSQPVMKQWQQAKQNLPSWHIKDVVRWPLRKSISWVVARPGLRHQISQKLQHVPWLYSRLLRFAHHYRVTPKDRIAARHAPDWFNADSPLSAQQQWQQQLTATTSKIAQAAPLAASEKPKLAFVSPVPAQRTGIADYSAELLPALAQHYSLYVITEQETVEHSWVQANCEVQNAAWLRTHASSFERVLYQVGNSHFHDYMLALMQEVPGVVVLHDFYLSGLLSYVEDFDNTPYVWTDALYRSHGYQALALRFENSDEAKYRYPVNFDVLAAAQGVIVHSHYSYKLAQQWYGELSQKNWSVVPHLRVPAPADSDKLLARQHLGINTDSFVVCSFGFLNPTKLNHRLLNAWLNSALAKDPHSLLIFVGENYQGEYGLALRETIKKHGMKDRVLITGFAEAEMFKHYLAAADMAVQLRTQSRGESSGTVLDCMNYGLPVIINANGSMAEIDEEAVYLLPDEFEEAALQTALERLWGDTTLRQRLGERAKAVIVEQHAPAQCAQQYATAIEQSVQHQYAVTPFRPNKRLFIDITATSNVDLKTGIERVVRALLLALLADPPAGYRVEPVYLSQKGGQWVYVAAHDYTLELVDCPLVLYESVVEMAAGDVVLGLDVSGQRLIQAQQAGLFERLRQQQVQVYFMVHDILPIRLPEVFPPHADKSHAEWARAIASVDGIVGVSQTAAEDFKAWTQENGLYREEFWVSYSHHGADVMSSAPSLGMPKNAQQVLNQLTARPTFLLVGTVEPRKGYAQVLQAFDLLWHQGVDVNLVIVGQEGWQGLADEARRDIPQTVLTLQQHEELDQRLYWLKGISDEYLERVYAASSCLVAASLDEGFGLPLIEAAQHDLPIIARDIPVFREVAGEHAYYFSGLEPAELAAAIEQWLDLYRQGEHPASDAMPWLTWAQSANQLVENVLARANSATARFT